MTTKELDPAQIEAFADKILGTLNMAVLALVT